jgi:uncharacterized protein (TIRG00374 family)
VEPKKRTAARWLLRLLGPALLAIIFVRLDDPGAVWRLFASAHPGWLALALAVNFVAIHLKVVRWQVMLRARGIHYATKDAWLAFSSSLYLAMTTPGRVGDVLRVQYLKHDAGASYAEGLASVVMDRLADLYVLSAFVAVAMVRYAPVIAGDLWILSWVVVAATVLGPLVLLVPGLAERLMTRAWARLANDPEADGLARFLGALRAQVSRTLVITLPLTVVSFLVGFGQGYLAALALGVPISFFDAVCLLAVANLMGLLPISMSGVGIREAFFAVVFPAIGLAAAQGVAFGLFVFLVVYVALAVIGFVSWQIKPPTFANAG